MSPNQVAQQLGISPRTVINFLRRGLLVGTQHPFSRRWTVEAASVRKLLRKAGQTGGTAFPGRHGE
jgi:predicted site-specific integrase-resolvase